jgi:hypothetical protein
MPYTITEGTMTTDQTVYLLAGAGLFATGVIFAIAAFIKD